MAGFTREQISRAVNAGAELVLDSLLLGERDEDLIDLVVNAALSKLDNPEVDLDAVVQEHYSEDLRGWWDFSEHVADRTVNPGGPWLFDNLSVSDP